MTAKSTRLSASQLRLAPRSNIKDSPLMVGKYEAMAGRLTPGPKAKVVLFASARFKWHLRWLKKSLHQQTSQHPHTAA